MKTAIYISTFLLIAALLTGCEGSAAVRKNENASPTPPITEKANNETKNNNPAVALEREKFDPARSASADLQQAIAKAQAENKRIVLDIGGEWCVWCRTMDNFLLKNQELAQLRDENFVWQKINFSPENENKEFLAAYPEVKGYPHLFVLEKDGKLLYSQDTSELEEGKSYNPQKFTDFLRKWSPENPENNTK